MSMKMIAGYFILMLMCLLGAFSAGEGVLTTKSCVTFDHKFTLKVEEFMGRWYEVRRLYDPLDPEREDCVVMNYEMLENGIFEIQKSFQMAENGYPSYVNGTARLRAIGESRVPQFYERLNLNSATAEGTLFNIVTTDYENYAILYSCTPINSTHNREILWVLSRLPAMETTKEQLMNLWLAGNIKRSEKEWRTTAQSPKFCHPSDLNELEIGSITEDNPVETSIEDSAETLSESISFTNDTSLNGTTHENFSDDSYSITSSILFWIGLLAGVILLLLAVWIIIARSTY